MKNSIGGFLMRSLQRETNNIAPEHLKVLSEFNVPIHKFSTLSTEEDKQNFLLDHMEQYIRTMMRSLDDFLKNK
jgi:hypothetical protein